MFLIAIDSILNIATLSHPGSSFCQGHKQKYLWGVQEWEEALLISFGTLSSGNRGGLGPRPCSCRVLRPDFCRDAGLSGDIPVNLLLRHIQGV